MSHQSIKTESGSSLIAMAIMVIVVGLMITGFLFIFQNQELVKKDQETINKSETITIAINDYVMRNGRLPCPAPLNAPRDSPFFGLEDPVQVCTSPNYYSAFIAARGIVSVPPLPACPFPGAPNCRPDTAGPPGNIKIGALPVRNLNLPDGYAVDGYGKRYVYAVTERLAISGINPNTDLGAIDIVDGDPALASTNSLPTQRAHVKYIFFSQGATDNGSYDIEGAPLTLLAGGETCDITTLSGHNCDFQRINAAERNATFVSSFFKVY